MNKKLISALLVLIMILCVGLTACDKEETPEVKAKAVFQRAAESADGYAWVQMSGDTFDVLMLSDPQVDTSCESKYGNIKGESNDNTYRMIEDLVAATSPDLVVIAGDLVMSTLESNERYMERYGELFERLETPWTFTFGNHDSESTFVYVSGGKSTASADGLKLFGQISKQKVLDVMSNYPHCLISAGDCEDGYGNNFINVKNTSGEIVRTICTLDTTYTGSGLDSDYSRIITEVQTDWYVDTLHYISDLAYGVDRPLDRLVPSQVYTHVGIPEFYTAWREAWNGGEPTEDYYYGVWCDGNYTSFESDFFPVAVELGSTDAIYFGHHHDNDFSVEYQNIRLTFGQHSGMSHSYRINRTDDSFLRYDFTNMDLYGDKRGGTMTTYYADGTFTITPKYATEVIPNYSEYQIDVEAAAADLIARGGAAIRANED